MMRHWPIRFCTIILTLCSLTGVAAASPPTGVIGIVLVNAGSIELEDPIAKDKSYVLCAKLRPAQPAYGFFQWGGNTQYMYNTRTLGPITAERRVCSSTAELNCGQKVFWRYFLIVDKVVLGFDQFGEFTACSPP